MSLYDEAKKSSSEKVAARVRDLGGSLYDEAGIKTKDTSRLTPRFTQQQLDAERQRLFDEMNAELSIFDKFFIGAGRGMTTIGRAVGLAEPEDAATKEAFGRLSDDSMAATIGEVIGEAAPFLAAAPLSGAGLATRAGGKVLIPAAQKAATRIAGASALGAAEGAAITRGRGGDAGETLLGGTAGGAVAGVIEAISPGISRLGRALFRRLGRKPSGPLLTADGRPTPEFVEALEATGTSFDELAEEAFAEVNQRGVNPEQAARAVRFESQGIPALAGDVTQDFSQQAKEQRLISMAGGESGEPLRQVKLEQSQQFENAVNDLVNDLGVRDEAGQSIKDALAGRRRLLQAEKNALYREVAETSPEVANAPILTDTIAEAIPDRRELRRLSRIAGSQIDAVRDLLVEFGVENTDELVEEFVESGGEITPLTIGNFEEFRQALNQIERADTTGASSVVIGPLREALDGEADLIDNALTQTGLAESSVVDTLRQARGTVRQIKTEFSPESITGRLINVKRDGVTPVIEASKVTNELLRPNAPIETLDRTLASLRQSGAEGQKAIKDLQASVVLNALENSLKAPSRKTSGIQTVGGNQFSKSLSDFGDDKLELLFGGNRKALNRLRNLQQTARDIEPTAGATPKGSAPVILDIMNRVGELPGLAAIRDTINLIVKAGADDRAVRRALKSKPAIKRAVTVLEQDFPAIASTLGIAGLAQLAEDEGE